MGDRVQTFFKELGEFPRALPPKPKRRSKSPQRERRSAWEREWQTNRKVALERALYRCELPGCDRRADVVHHKAGRRVADANRLDRLVALCHDCHSAVHANPEWSYLNGWMERHG